MKLKKNQIISLKVILLFSIAILSTFVADYLRLFLGDWKCEGSGNSIVGTWRHEKCNYTDFHDASWHWGYRHWLYLGMCLSLFVIQVIEIVNYANSKEN
jgi:hypothetical protein